MEQRELTQRQVEDLDKAKLVWGNPEEFFKLVKISDPQEGIIGAVLWKHLEYLLRVLSTYKRVIILKSRQIGVSWLLASWVTRRIIIQPESRILMTSEGQTEAAELLDKCRFIYNHLPDYLKVEKPLPDGAEAFGLPTNNSRILALPSTEKAGSGFGATDVVADELDKHEYAEKNFITIKPTVDAGGQYIGCFTVNTEEPNSFPKRLFKDAREGLNGFFPVFLGWRSRPDRDDAWYQQTLKEFISTPGRGLPAMRREYPDSEQEALSPITAQSAFDKDRLQTLWNMASEPETRQGYIHIYQKPRPGLVYGAGVDTGEGVGGDYSVLTIIGKYGLQSEVVALIYSNTIKTDLFSYEIDKLCREYFNPKLVVENNAVGIAVLNELQRLGYPNLYHDGKKLGWTSSGKGFVSSKATAFVDMTPDIDNGILVTRYKPQIQELMEMQWVKSVPTAAGATHGDTVISLMLANIAIKQARPTAETKVIYTLDKQRRRYVRPRLRY